jgi:hypothetical protein
VTPAEGTGGRRMFRYVVPVDGQPHIVPLSHSPAGVGATDRFVEFWAESTVTVPPALRAFQVFGTGHPLPGQARWVGTAPRTPGGFVWHLYELPLPAGEEAWQ